jgi:AcrR family transcriptional regulator
MTNGGIEETQARGVQARADILRAAEELMAAKGYWSTTMADLIRLSGVPSSSIYWHFTSKSGVLAAVMAQGAAAFFEGIIAAGQTAGQLPPRESLERMLRQSATAVAENPSFLTLYISFLLHQEQEPAVLEHVAEVRQQALEVIRTHLAQSYSPYGAERAQRIADRVAPLAIAMFDGLFISQQSSDQINMDVALSDVATALHGVAEGIA